MLGGVVSLLSIAVIAVGTVAVLKIAEPHTSVVQSAPLTSVSDIMTAIQKDGAIPSLDKTTYTMSDNTLGASSVNTKSDAHSYAISVPAKESVLFSANNPSKPGDTTKIHADITAVMKQLGLTETTSIPDDSLPNLVYTTFSHSRAVCQLVDNVTPSAATHEITCVDAKAVANAYDTIEQHLAMYRAKGKSLEAFTRVTSFTKTKDTISYTLLTLTSGPRVTHALLFATVDKNEEYVGDVMSGDSKYSNGKYTIAPDTLKALSDPKYNGFLLKNFTGQASAPTN